MEQTHGSNVSLLEEPAGTTQRLSQPWPLHRAVCHGGPRKQEEETRVGKKHKEETEKAELRKSHVFFVGPKVTMRS